MNTILYIAVRSIQCSKFSLSKNKRVCVVVVSKLKTQAKYFQSPQVFCILNRCVFSMVRGLVQGVLLQGRMTQNLTN